MFDFGCSFVLGTAAPERPGKVCAWCGHRAAAIPPRRRQCRSALAGEVLEHTMVAVGVGVRVGERVGEVVVGEDCVGVGALRLAPSQIVGLLLRGGEEGHSGSLVKVSTTEERLTAM